MVINMTKTNLIAVFHGYSSQVLDVYFLQGLAPTVIKNQTSMTFFLLGNIKDSYPYNESQCSHHLIFFAVFLLQKKANHTGLEQFLNEEFLQNFTQVCLIRVVTPQDSSSPGPKLNCPAVQFQYSTPDHHIRTSGSCSLLHPPQPSTQN